MPNKRNDELIKKILENNKKRRLLDDSDYVDNTEDDSEEIDNSEEIGNMNSEEKSQYKKEQNRFNLLLNNQKPLKFQIYNLNCNDNIKIKALKYLNLYELDRENNANYLEAVNLICRINWTNYHDLNISEDITKLTEFLENAYKIMNDVIHSQNNAKMEILEYLASSSKERVIGLTGSAGVGKTTLIKNALSRCFNNRPFYYISLGGITDVSILSGSAPVWKGSNAGRLVDALIETKCMNPIIYFDEIDKVGPNSNIHEWLIHLIDPVYNTHIYNNFLDIAIDFSKVMFVFSYNNKNLINKVLLDRIKVVEMVDYTQDEMHIIAEKYIIPQILQEMKMPNDLFIFSPNIIKYINTKMKDNSYSIRPLIRLYQDIISKIYMNYIISSGSDNSVLKKLYNIQVMKKKNKIIITEKLIDEIKGSGGAF